MRFVLSFFYFILFATSCRFVYLEEQTRACFYSVHFFLCRQTSIETDTLNKIANNEFLVKNIPEEVVRCVN